MKHIPVLAGQRFKLVYTPGTDAYNRCDILFRAEYNGAEVIAQQNVDEEIECEVLISLASGDKFSLYGRPLDSVYVNPEALVPACLCEENIEQYDNILV